MTETIITTGGLDTWVNSAKPSVNYGDTARLPIKSGEREVLTRPPLPNILGRTVASATLYAHAGGEGLAAQTFTYRPAVAHWTQGGATWGNRPGVAAARGGSTVIGALPADALVAFDVTADLQGVADGTDDYHGWKLTTSSTSWGQWFRSKESGDPAWELHVTLAADADEPANLRPDGGGAVATAEPILAWDFDDQQSYQVQVDTPAVGVDPDAVAPDYDSGWVTAVDPQHDLAAAVYTPPAGTAPTFWRVRVTDGDGNESAWSPWAEFTVAAVPSLIVDSPVGAVGDPRVSVAAHLSAGTVASWEVWATGPDRSDVRWRSGVRDGAIDVQVPAKNADKRAVFTEGTGGWLYIKAQDTVDRATAVGQQVYVDTWVEVTFAADGTLIAPTSLSVAQTTDIDGNADPRLVWRFTITDIPDAVNLMSDGVTFETIDAADLPTPSSGVYTITDGGQVSPMRPHTLGVAAVWAGKASTPNTRDHRHSVNGLWLIPDADIEPVWLAGTAVSGFAKGDRRATYTPVKGAPVDITYDYEGMSGTFEGFVDSRQDVWGALDRIEALRVSRNRLARLVWGSQSIMVRMRDIHSTSSDEILPNNLQHVVRFGFVQVGD